MKPKMLLLFSSLLTMLLAAFLENLTLLVISTGLAFIYVLFDLTITH